METFVRNSSVSVSKQYSSTILIVVSLIGTHQLGAKLWNLWMCYKNIHICLICNGVEVYLKVFFVVFQTWAVWTKDRFDHKRTGTDRDPDISGHLSCKSDWPVSPSFLIFVFYWSLRRLVSATCYWRCLVILHHIKTGFSLVGDFVGGRRVGEWCHMLRVLTAASGLDKKYLLIYCLIS